jgi:hypothetical protein
MNRNPNDMIFNRPKFIKFILFFLYNIENQFNLINFYYIAIK